MALAGEDAAVKLLQLNAGRVTEAVKQWPAGHNMTFRMNIPGVNVNVKVNSTKVWSELRAAVDVDKLKAEIEKAKDTPAVKQLQKELQELQQQFPSTDEVKRHFAAQWQNITEAIDVEALQDELAEALSTGSDQVHQLQHQLQAAMNGQNPEDWVKAVQNQTADTWAYLQEHDIPLPNINDLTEQAEDFANRTAQSMSWLLNSSLGDYWHNFTNQLNLSNSTVRDAVEGAKEQVHKVAESVDAIFGTDGLFGNLFR